MIKYVRKISKGQSGAGLAAVLLVIFLIGLIGGGYWLVTTQTDLYAPDESEMPTEPELMEYKGFGCAGLDSDSGQSNSPYGMVFIAPYSMELTTVSFRLSYYGSGTEIIRCDVYEFDFVEWERGQLIGTSGNWLAKDMLEKYECSHCLQPWAYFPIEAGCLIMEDGYYSVEWKIISGSGGQIFSNNDDNDGCEGEVTLGRIGQPISQFNYWVTGFTVAEPQVVTVGHVLESDGSITMQGWTDVVANMHTGFLVSINQTELEDNTGVRYEDGESGTGVSRFYFNYRLHQLLSDVQYFYKAYATASGSSFYGDIKSFTRGAGDIPLDLSCEVIRNDLDSVEFNSVMMGAKAGVTYDVEICYGACLAEMQSCNWTIGVDAAATADETWRTISLAESNFIEGQKYWYRLSATGDDSSISYSPTNSFIRYDSSQPAIINWVADVFGFDFNWIWWVIAIIGLLAVWLIAGWMKQRWIGVIGTGVFMVVLITFGFVNEWVVVLLAIIVGWIIFKLVFKHSGGTG